MRSNQRSKARTSRNHATAVCVEPKEAIGIYVTGELSRLLQNSDRRLKVTLRGFPAYFVFLGRHLPPVRQVTALPAVELHRNVVVAAWTSTSVVRLGFHCVGPLLQICLRRSQHCYLSQ